MEEAKSSPRGAGEETAEMREGSPNLQCLGPSRQTLTKWQGDPNAPGPRAAAFEDTNLCCI